MKIMATKKSVKCSDQGYLYFTKHGLGPGTLPKDVKLVNWRDVDDNITAIWLDRFLTTRELKEYDIYPETSDKHKMYSKKLNSCTITASHPDNSYQHYYAYDYKGKNRFSIHYDDVTNIEDPELSFKQFRASLSPIKPYDDADYAWARIQNGSIDYFRKGKLIKKEYYFMFDDYGTDEDGLYEDANDWMNDVINKACDTLIDLNQNVEPVIIHNPKSIQSATANNEYRVDDITASTVLDMNPEFRNNFEEAVDFFYEDYPATVELTDEVDEDYDTLYKAYVKETGSLYQQTPGIVYIDINWDSGEILQALQETAEAIGLQEYNTFYSSIESSDYESDSGIFMEDIIDSLKDNGYDLSRIRSIRQGLLELFGYKGKDADIIIHDLVAGGFIDPNDWVDKDYTPGIYSATEEDGEDLPMVDQEYDSAATSINSTKLPAIYKMVSFNEGDVIVDFGGGKFDNAVEYIKDAGATLVVYDPYNRSAEHNREVLEILRENGGADAAVNSNVLNVIKEPEARKNVLENIARITKPGAPIYITVYEGRGDSQEGPTKSGYQLNRKTADYLEEIQEVFPDATRKGKLIVAHNSASVASFTDVESYEDAQYIDRVDKDIDSYDLIARKDIEDADGFFTEYAIYQIILKDGSMEYECYFGDSDIYGPWNGDGLDFESDSYDESVAWYNSYVSKDVTTSTITSAHNDSKILTTEEIDAMLNNLKADLHSTVIATMTSEEFGFDEKGAEYYTRIEIRPDPDYDGVTIEVRAELSYDGLDELREVLDKTLNKYIKHAYFDMAEPGILETYFTASDIIQDNVSSSNIIAGPYDVPERPLDPPDDYDEGTEVSAESTIEIPFNQVITIHKDGSWDYSDNEYNFTKTDDGKSDHYDEEYDIYLDDNVGIVEKLDGFLEDKLPSDVGTYRIQGTIKLVYDIENILEYSNDDGYWSEDDGFNEPSYETFTDNASVYYNESKSSLNDFKYMKLK